MMIIRINYYFQKKEKFLKIFTMKDLIIFYLEELNKKIDCDNVKYIVKTTGI